MKSDRHKIRAILRREMKKIMGKPPKHIEDLTFYFCWCQAKFDTLMDLDRELELGAFIKRRR